MIADNFNLQRFADAQDSCYETVCAELGAGRKRSHWMWFVFPQLKGLGQSAMSEFYGMSGRDEARAYLAHAVLGPRLTACTELVLAARPRPAEDIFGFPDHLKFHSSMTLFAAAAADAAVFETALAAFFGGVRDAPTMRLFGITRARD